MKMLRYLFAIVLGVGLTSVAKAGPVGFQMVVVDPPHYVDILTPTDYPVTTLSLSACVPGQVPPADGSFDGCFTGLNDTGHALTSLEILVPVAAGPPTCVAISFFSSVSCNTKTSNGLDYIIDFSGGPGIPTATDCDGPHGTSDDPGGKLDSDDFNAPCNADTIFTIAESSSDPLSDFKNLTVIADAPEPSSLWLLSTGVLSVGLFFGDWRRRALCRTRG